MILSTLLRGSGLRGGGNPADERWWLPPGQRATSGVMMTPDRAMTVSTVFACVRILAETIGALPFDIMRRTSDGGRELADYYPLHALIHDQPNDVQTSLEWRETVTGHVALRGNGYNYIQPGPGGAVDQLWPLHPDRVTVEINNGSGTWENAATAAMRPSARVRYVYSLPGLTPIVYMPEEIFHLRGFGGGGLLGWSIIKLARETFGLALATEQHGARLFSQGARPGGVLQTDKSLGDKARANLRESMHALHAGLENVHRTMVLEEGLKWEQVALSNDDSQFLQTRSFQVAEIARWFRMPLVMLQEHEKSTTWGSGVQAIMIAFATYTLLPWVRRWEQGIKRDLVVGAEQGFYARLDMRGLLRGDDTTRTAFYGQMLDRKVFTINEVRGWEDLNAVPWGDEPVDPPAPPPGPAQTLPSSTPPDPDPPADPAPPKKDKASKRAEAIATAAAARVVRKEVAGLHSLARRYASDTAGWGDQVEAFYGRHAALVAEALSLEQNQAAQYTTAQRDTVMRDGMAAVEAFEGRCVPELVALALGAEQLGPPSIPKE